MTEGERFFYEVRLMQRRTRCSNHVCEKFVGLFRKYVNPGRGMHSFDKKARNVAGVNYIVLHGCPQCKKYIYKPNDEHINCPYQKHDGTICGHPRYNSVTNQPLEVLVM